MLIVIISIKIDYKPFFAVSVSELTDMLDPAYSETLTLSSPAIVDLILTGNNTIFICQWGFYFIYHITIVVFIGISKPIPALFWQSLLIAISSQTGYVNNMGKLKGILNQPRVNY